MPQLRHICFFSENLVGVEALLDGCPHLESLVLDIQPHNSTPGVIKGTFKMMKELPLNPASTWSTIRVDIEISELSYRCGDKFNHVKDVIRRAVDKSCGGLVDVDLGIFMSADILSYVGERCTRITRLRGSRMRERPFCRLGEAPLENLELVYFGTVSVETIQTIGRCYPRLTSLEIPISDDEGAKTLARSLPQLRHIFLTGENFVTDLGVEALLDGCPNLESLVLAFEIRLYYSYEPILITGAFRMMKLPLTRTQCRDILDGPSTWSTIRVDVNRLFRSSHEKLNRVKDVIRRAVDKSCGGLVDVNLDKFMSEDMLSYVVERCTKIRRLYGHIVSLDCAEKALCTAAPRLPLLENLQLSYNYGGTLSTETIETLGRCCPRLTSLEIPIENDEGAKTLARNLPQLRHLKPICAYKLTDVGVEALLDGCPNLESLDLADCNHIRLYGTLGIRCAQQIKHLQKPKRYYCLNYSCCGLTKYMTVYEYDLLFEIGREEAERREREAKEAAAEGDIYDVNYTIDNPEEYSSRRGKVRGKEIRVQYLRREECNKNRHIRREKGNKNIPNTNTERHQKARRRRREFDSMRKAKRDYVH